MRDQVFAKRLFRIFATALFFIFFFAGPAYSLEERIDVSQSANGEIVAQLHGILYPCTIAVGSDSLVTSLLPNEFEITTTAYELACPFNPDALPFPYSRTAELGLLSDGNYTINWKFLFFNGTLPVASQTFVISPSSAV